jgi:succinylarginine dihydrolase
VKNYFELQIDGLPNCGHCFGGLSKGNLSSEKSKGFTSYPFEAFKQSLLKMSIIHNYGVTQSFLPPLCRPNLSLLHNLGYLTDKTNLANTLKQLDDELLYTVWSSSFMWTANMGTFTPSLDSKDGYAHLSIANLITNKHRSIEANERYQQLSQFMGSDLIHVHPPLTPHKEYSDEGAANHMRICPDINQPGLNIFVYNRKPGTNHSHQIPLRQSICSQESIVRRHNLMDNNVIYLEQNPDCVKAGVFHNDVIAMSCDHILIIHEDAFNATNAIDTISKKYLDLTEKKLGPLILTKNDLSVSESVSTYLFNSQILNTSHGYILIAPTQCYDSKKAQQSIRKIINHYPEFCDVRYIDLTQSMLNGGGPACLRNRLVLNNDEYMSIKSSIQYTQKTDQILHNWAEKHYRKKLTLSDLRDVSLVEESFQAQIELNTILRNFKTSNSR